MRVDACPHQPAPRSRSRPLLGPAELIAWTACILLSVYLVTGRLLGAHAALVLLALLAVFLAPLSIQYSYVWMMFPFTTMLYLALVAPAGSPLRQAAIWGLAGSVGLLLLSIYFPRFFAAYGNIFFAGCALFIAQRRILQSGWLREIRGRSCMPA